MSDVVLEPRVPPSTVEGDVVDRRVRALLDEYVLLTGAQLDDGEPGLLRLRVCVNDVQAFRGRADHVLALDLDTLERHSEAELPVIGSAFWESLVGAIRRHGQRRVSGNLPVTVTDDAAVPDVAVVDAAVELVGRRRETRRIVRLTAKVAIAAGTAIVEEVIQGDAIDLATGHELPASVVPFLDAPDEPQSAMDAPRAAAASADRLVPTLIQGLEDRVAARLEALHAQSERDLKAELSRIDGYYGAVKADVIAASGPDTAAVRTVEHEHEKRRAEEIRRHEVRVSVEPLQVLERGVIVERVTWRLATSSGRTAELHGQRYLSGDGGWGVHCDVCHRQPEGITVCRHGHAVGTECTLGCSVCAERFCRAHGHAGCAIDGEPVCYEHAAECWSCDRVHCTGHQGSCTDGDHAACVECLTACAICARTVCRKHALETVENSPRGRRTLCSGCVVYCERATSEPIGRDEAEECGTCGDFICERHQVRCVVDQKPHCSKHIRRSDRSRRFICNEHIAACGHEESDVLFAADEVHACVECRRVSCDSHGAACHGDDRWHCREHLAVLTDHADALGCDQHRSTCHVDGRTFSLEGTKPCEVCTRATCRTHTNTCGWCGARVCAKDSKDGRCLTCAQLRTADDLPDDVISALARISGDVRPKERLIARDGSRFIVQLDLGWTRKVVVTVPYGAAEASRVIRHSLFGTKGLGS